MVLSHITSGEIPSVVDEIRNLNQRILIALSNRGKMINAFKRSKANGLYDLYTLCISSALLQFPTKSENGIVSIPT